MQVSPEAERFSEIHPIEETEEFRKKFERLCEEGKIVSTPVRSATVRGSRETLKALQEDLRRAGYKKIV